MTRDWINNELGCLEQLEATDGLTEKGKARLVEIRGAKPTYQELENRVVGLYAIIKETAETDHCDCGSHGKDRDNYFCDLCEGKFQADDILAGVALPVAKLLDEAALVQIIEDWKFGWMNVTGTTAEDAANYRRRSFGIDANMIYGLARRLKTAICDKKEVSNVGG